MPARIRQERRAGWRKPPGARSVVRGTVFGNPWGIDRGTGRAFVELGWPQLEERLALARIPSRVELVELHRLWLEGLPLPPDVPERAAVLERAMPGGGLRCCAGCRSCAAAT